MRVEKADSSMLPLILTFQYRQEWPHGEMDSVKGGFPRRNETLGTSTQGSGVASYGASVYPSEKVAIEKSSTQGS